MTCEKYRGLPGCIHCSSGISECRCFFSYKSAWTKGYSGYDTKIVSFCGSQEFKLYNQVIPSGTVDFLRVNWVCLPEFSA